jgi:hypothetical protein
MQIQVSVYIPSPQYFRDMGELGVWDTLGASEELDYSMPIFPKSLFAKPDNASSSTTEGFYWQVRAVSASEASILAVRAFPCVIFWDASKKIELGRMEGAPIERGTAANLLNNILPKSKKNGLWWLVLLGGFALKFVR